jgi:cytochrome c biogenesis protein CcdA/glutathione peroxidase-family protein
MQADLINVGLAFIEGFALIISPCILPVLPIILSGSLTGDKSRPLGIVTGFIVTFALFTLFSRILIQFTAIDLNTVRHFSFGILLLLGIIMMSKTLTDIFNRLTQSLSNVGSSFQSANNPQSGFFGGLLFGGLIGIIWTPCAGPVLAAVIVQVVLQQTTLNSMLVVIAFAIGVGIPMLLIAFLGRRMLTSFGFVRDKSIFIRQILGFIIVLTVLYFLFFQAFTFSLNQQGKPTLTNTPSLINGISQPYQAPEISGISAWINSPPLNWNDLKGKVVLIDFWTYSCINCIRTLPYLKEWYAKYHKEGFEIIGVHSPEFQFEQDVNNVKNAVKVDQIQYPVALDNTFTTWRNFQNQYWPAHYLVNKEGKVVYVHFGEGEYDVTENNIRFLLGMDKVNNENKVEENVALNLTPETYFGYKRAERFANTVGMIKDVSAQYIYPDNLAMDDWALNGNWLITPETIIAKSADAAIKVHFRARKVYMVMGVTKKPVTVKLLLNGKPLAENKGSDVVDNQVIVNHHQLYSLVNLAKGNDGTLEIRVTGPGLEAYTFTFGN